MPWRALGPLRPFSVIHGWEKGRAAGRRRPGEVMCEATSEAVTTVRHAYLTPPTARTNIPLRDYWRRGLASGGYPPMVSKQERLEEIYRRLKASAAANDLDEALELVRLNLNAVEDELSGVPYDPANWQNDGRLYPPLPDSVRPVAGLPGVKRFRSFRHNTFVAVNGAIEIRTIDGTLEFSKFGRDGKGVPRA